MFKPSAIQKSKRGQLEEKILRKQDSSERTNKIRQVEPIDLDSDLDDDRNTIRRLETQLVDLENELNAGKQIPKAQEPPKQQLFNKFNYARLEKINIPVNVDSIPIAIKRPQVGVVMDDGKIDDKELDAYKAYIFQVEGSKQQYNVRKVILKDKALFTNSKGGTKGADKNQQASKETKEQATDDKDDDLCERKNRYFEISHEVCFKCNKEGHYAKNCIEDEARKCKTCFSREHDERSCPQVCYECGAVGHISSECPESRQKRCDRCQKRGHTTDCCGVIIGEKLNLNKLENYFLESDLKKLKCIIEDVPAHENKGYHFNCFQYKDWPMPYHQLRKGNKNQQIRNMQTDSYRTDFNKQRRFSVEQLYKSGNSYEHDRAYNHYRDRFQREYGMTGYDNRREQGQNRSFDQHRSVKGHGGQSSNQSRSWKSGQKNQRRGY